MRTNINDPRIIYLYSLLMNDEKSISNEVLYSFVCMSRLAHMGVPLMDAWEKVLLNSNDGRTRQLCTDFIDNWKNLPHTKALRVHPTVQKYEVLSIEWMILSKFTFYGEAIGILGNMWRDGVALILLKRKLQKDLADQSDVNLFDSVVSFIPNDILESQFQWKDWSRSPIWLGRKPTQDGFSDPEMKQWLMDRGGHLQADVFKGIQEVFKKSASESGTLDLVEEELNWLRLFKSLLLS